MAVAKLSDFSSSRIFWPLIIATRGVASRIQLTGHSHQAIPDVAERGYAEHWDVLNKYGEERWEEVFAALGVCARDLAN